MMGGGMYDPYMDPMMMGGGMYDLHMDHMMMRAGMSVYPYMDPMMLVGDTYVLYMTQRSVSCTLVALQTTNFSSITLVLAYV